MRYSVIAQSSRYTLQKLFSVRCSLSHFSSFCSRDHRPGQDDHEGDAAVLRGCDCGNAGHGRDGQDEERTIDGGRDSARRCGGFCGTHHAISDTYREEATGDQDEFGRRFTAIRCRLVVHDVVNDDPKVVAVLVVRDRTGIGKFQMWQDR